MVVYVAVSITIVMMGLYLEFINSKPELKSHKKLPNYFFIIPSFLLLFIISAFRGDFTTDYKNYANLFDLYNQFDFWRTFQVGLDQEIGYIFLSRLIGVFTSNEIYLFIVVSIIILACFYSQFNKYSAYIWLSALMFITVGSFYSSFNIMRQILAVAIVFAGSKFLYERKTIKYFLVVIAASLFHTTSLIMIPFYFILNLRVNLKNTAFIFVGAAISFVFLENIISIVQTVFYTTYTADSYGMTGQIFTNALLPITFLIFGLYHYKKIDQNNAMHRIWFNAIVFNAVFSVLSLKVQLVERVAHFFNPYVLLLIPLIFSKMQNKYLRIVYMMVLIFLLIAYNYIVFEGTEYDPYYFIWDKP